jgi:hypothetical protein
MPHRSPGVPGISLTVRRFVRALAALLLLVTPALDLAWNEPELDENQGIRCQLHVDRVPLLGPSIFVPPRV